MNGPRPSPLTIRESSAKITKKSRAPRPVVVYLRSPKIIHVRPEEFMGLVQQLTGKKSAAAAAATAYACSTSTCCDAEEAGGCVAKDTTFEVPSRISSSYNFDGYSSANYIF
ncbi:VQ motif containing protein [Parasponia andersonii]|uniref:VQ motif containing protein n=1 Tax=Parasponia andersonii TaxID=3476 RepID=A0A2P5B814_PARAD|nr:VQ motif containing protein [Parasponia andersonii]